MNTESNKNKSDLARLILEMANNNSQDADAAKKFLTDEGLNADKKISDGLKRIKQMQMNIEAEKTKREMEEAENERQQAIEWVDKILSVANFSLPTLIQEEELAVNFRNLENMSREDLRNTLIKHFTLKFIEQRNENKQ